MLKLLEDKIKSLEAGVMCYPEEATFVRDKINEELGEQSKKADAKLLCELLYMTDDSWQDAVESYLNTQRFNIIVAPDNYLVAKKVFISLGDKVKKVLDLLTQEKLETFSIVGRWSKLSLEIRLSPKIFMQNVMQDLLCEM